MRQTLTTLAALAFLSPVFAEDRDAVVGSGKIVSETRKLAEFDAIELRIRGNAYVTIGKPSPLEITGDDNILPLIKAEVHERRLVISAEREFKTKQAPNLKITVANLQAATIAGSGDMHISGVNNESLSLNVRGSGDLRFEGKTAALAVNIAGSGDARLTGKADQFAAGIAGSGDIHGFDLTAGSATVSIKGSGDAKVNVAKALSIQIVGSGELGELWIYIVGPLAGAALGVGLYEFLRGTRGESAAPDVAAFTPGDGEDPSQPASSSSAPGST